MWRVFPGGCDIFLPLWYFLGVIFYWWEIFLFAIFSAVIFFLLWPFSAVIFSWCDIFLVLYFPAVALCSALIFSWCDIFPGVIFSCDNLVVGYHSDVILSWWDIIVMWYWPGVIFSWCDNFLWKFSVVLSLCDNFLRWYFPGVIFSWWNIVMLFCVSYVPDVVWCPPYGIFSCSDNFVPNVIFYDVIFSWCDISCNIFLLWCVPGVIFSCCIDRSL